jgi:hypothetical protein
MPSPWRLKEPLYVPSINVEEDRDKWDDSRRGVIDIRVLLKPVTSPDSIHFAKAIPNICDLRFKLTSTMITVDGRSQTIVCFCAKILNEFLDYDYVWFLEKVIKKFLKYLIIDARCILVATMLLKRAASNGIKIKNNNFVIFLCAATMISVKFNEDVYWKNSTWASMFNIGELELWFREVTSKQYSNSEKKQELLQLNKAEAYLLKKLRYKIMVRVSDVEDFVEEFWEAF